MTRPLLLLLLVACAKQPDAPQGPPPAQPAATAPAAATAPGDGHTSAPTLFAHMVEHYASITTARDSLIGGRLDVAQKELGWIATHTTDPRLAAGQQVMVEAMQREATAVFIAGTPGEGARALSRSAMWCGQCHLAAGVTAGVDDSPPPAGDGVLPHMLRHRWMVDRLWEGLIGPSDEAWTRGAAALVAEAALLPSATPHGEHRGYAVDVMSRYVHEAGEAAAEAKDPSARAKVLGDLLATCADCHDESRRQP
jgi:hypothetical protein